MELWIGVKSLCTMLVDDFSLYQLFVSYRPAPHKRYNLYYRFCSTLRANVVFECIA